MEEKISKNRILINHSKWLRDNGLTEKADECLKQANEHTDERQVNGRKKYEATNLHASSNGVGDAQRIPRLKRA